MSAQNLKNHSRYVPLHLAAYLLTGVILGVSIVKFWKSYTTGIGGLVMPSILILNALVLVLALWYGRWFALRAQDKAIRAEENLRHFVLTGKLLDSQLRMGQIVALRFAPDNEFVSLAQRAAKENLPGKEIKQLIVNWKADNNRA